MTLQEKALEIAVSQIGQEEKPRGSNWGEPVKSYLAVVGITFPASWCMAFMYWCFYQAAKELGRTIPLVKTGGVLNAWQKAPASAKVTDPQPGDIFIQDHGHGLGHTGIVVKVNKDGTIDTIEGNTNDTGSREGYEVCRRTRSRAKILGYLRFE
jgi:surface antigen